MSVKTVRRMARKAHRCDGCERWTIAPGHAYLSGVVFPGADFYGGKVPSNFKECAFCAERYGRSLELEPMPAEQAHAVYLNATQEGRG